MTDRTLDRRDLLATGALLTAGAAMLGSTGAVAQAAAAAPAAGGTAFAPQPLPLFMPPTTGMRLPAFH